MKTGIAALFVGFLFAIGLGISGMTQPALVVSFLDVFGDWNPALIFVMAGALAVHIVLFRLITRRQSPLFTSEFQLPKRRDIDRRLIIGAALFGVGWGLAGYCPAPAVVALSTFTKAPVIFVASMLAGMILCRFVDCNRQRTM